MKEKSNLEKYAERYLKKKGYIVELIKQWQSKTIYRITKDGLEYVFELPYAVVDKKRYMEFIENCFEAKKKLEDLKKQLHV